MRALRPRGAPRRCLHRSFHRFLTSSSAAFLIMSKPPFLIWQVPPAYFAAIGLFLLASMALGNVALKFVSFPVKV